jgi:hypothetical protein
MAEYSSLIAQALGVPVEDRHVVRLASTMHDIGKVAVPDAILLKPGRLTPEERTVMETHAQAGHDMLAGSGNALLELAATIALFPTSAQFDPAVVDAFVVALPGILGARARYADAGAAELALAA